MEEDTMPKPDSSVVLPVGFDRDGFPEDRLLGSAAVETVVECIHLDLVVVEHTHFDLVRAGRIHVGPSVLAHSYSEAHAAGGIHSESGAVNIHFEPVAAAVAADMGPELAAVESTHSEAAAAEHIRLESGDEVVVAAAAAYSHSEAPVVVARTCFAVGGTRFEWFDAVVVAAAAALARTPSGCSGLVA
mmetsp:Transcript_117323/g.175203  ORF Transcript_117323/g.175203 Transcript_117323/m.175203 type:complete len:188 (+) Transcript_117323:882-1445(+)